MKYYNIYIYLYYGYALCVYKLVPRPPTFKTGSTPLLPITL